MSANNYYTETLAEAFCSIDKWEVWNALTEEEQQELGEAITGAAENYGTYSGHEHIADPRDAEIDRLKAQHKREMADAEAQSELFRNSVARHNGVEPHRIYVNHGEIFVSRT